MILAIDPGPETSGYVIWDGRAVLEAQSARPNGDLLWRVNEYAHDLEDQPSAQLAIERVACYGAPVGDTVLETVYWSGRFAQAWCRYRSSEVVRLRFGDVALHHCHSRRAKESYVRQVLIDRFGLPGTKQSPGVFYRVHGHAWSALALAVAVADLRTTAPDEAVTAPPASHDDHPATAAVAR